MGVKRTLYLLLAVIVAGFVCVFAVSYLGGGLERRLVRLNHYSLRLENELLQARRQEKNFINRKDVAYVAKVAEHVKVAQSDVLSMKSLDPDKAVDLDKAGELLSAYRAAFEAFADNAVKTGMTGLDGLAGAMVKSGRDLETLARASGDPEPLVKVLQLRRQEKNFQMRGGDEYVQRVRNLNKDVTAWAEQAGDGRLAAESNRYSTLFTDYLSRERESTALLNKLVQAGRAVEPAVALLAEHYDRTYQAMSERIRLVLVAVEAAILLGVVLIILGVVRAITRSLNALQKYSRAVAGGDFKAKANGEIKGEFHLLRLDLAAMVGNLEKTMERVREKEQEAQSQAKAAQAASDEATAQARAVQDLLDGNRTMAEKAQSISARLSAAAVQLSSQSEQVTQGAEVQKNRMAETAVAMEQMNATVREISRNASEAARMAQMTRENAMTGAKVVESVGQAMARVNDLSLRLKQDMESLGRDADSVGQVINVINEIADQTNLLALNAAIEAARAGDAGRGFAVVADEVRKLAEKTMHATQEVENRILAIQEAARRNIGVMDEASQAVTNADGLARNSGEALREILGHADNTAAQVQGIATASEEQSAASEQINRAVDEVNTIATESVQGMSDSTRAVVGLADMAGELQGIIASLHGGAA